jgi:hypothetical protein
VSGSGWASFGGRAEDIMIERFVIMGVEKPPAKLIVLKVVTTLT